MNKEDKVIDPVCQMQVDIGSHEYIFQGMSFSFCSRQCHERFKHNPHLYIGKPGKPAAKQQGISVIRKRRLLLDSPVPQELEYQIYAVLDELMGIKKISISGDSIEIIYDLLEVSTQQIETALEDKGKALSITWRNRLKNAFIHYIEDTELDNLEHRYDTHGCHHK